MVFISNGMFYILATVITTTLIAISYFKWRFSYWKRLGLPYREPTIPFGNFIDIVKQTKSVGQVISEIYTEMKQKEIKHAGIYFFHMPIYMPLDLKLIKRVLQSDFDHFTDRGVYFNEKDDPLSAHLFALEGIRWKNTRAKLSPTFTPGKMKMMFPLVVKTSGELKAVLDTYSPDYPIEMKNILARLTTDIIGTCAFGLECNSLRDFHSEFRKYGKRLFDLTGKEVARAFISFVCRDLMRFFGAKVIPEEVAKFFLRIVGDTIKYRQANDVKRNDFLQLLIEMQDEAEGSKFSFEELAAHAFIFYIAGFETSSNTMSLSLLELALNQEIQEKLRNEIDVVLSKHGGELTYEAMLEMHYMDMIINETLRKHPPVPVIPRVCTKDYRIPNTDIVLKTGTKIFIPAHGLHCDPEYFENPEIFDPTRFADENKQNIRPFTFLPFGEGPRICIGMRFGLMQTKVGLAILLKHYKFKLNSKTKLPIKPDPKNFINTLLEGIWMNIEKISP